MPNILQTTYSNIPAYPKSWYWQNTNWAAKTVSVAADRYKLTSPAAIQVDVGGLSLTNEVAQELDLSVLANWDTDDPTDYTVAAARAGKDFYVYACVGVTTVPVMIVSANATYPDNYDATNSRKIGGFHCLCASVGTIANHPLTGYLTGDILPTTVWDLKKRCRNLGNNNNGMAYIASLDDWWAIYLASGTATAPVSIYNATILDTIDWNDSVDAGRAVGMRLPRDGEFQVAAALSNEQTSIYGSADPVTTGGHVDTAGRRMISRYGLEDCVGVKYQWLDEQSYRFNVATAHTHSATENATSGAASADVAPAWEWKDLPLDKGQLYRQGAGATGYGDVKAVAGGCWGDGSSCGSRCRVMNMFRWNAPSTESFRLCCPSLTK